MGSLLRLLAIGVVSAAGWRPPAPSFNRRGLATPFADSLRTTRPAKPAVTTAGQPRPDPRSRESTAPKSEHTHPQSHAQNHESRPPAVQAIEWTQTDTVLGLAIRTTPLAPATTQVKLSTDSVELNITGGIVRLTLHGEILPGKSTWEMSRENTGVKLSLVKKQKGEWAQLATAIVPPGLVPHGGAAPGLFPMVVGAVQILGPLEPNSEWLIGRSDQVAAAMLALEGTCCTRGFGWWSYSVCHSDRVTQWHAESTTVAKYLPWGPPEGVDFISLGKLTHATATGAFLTKAAVEFAEDENGHKQGKTKKQKKQKKRTPTPQFHSSQILQSFGGGDHCSDDSALTATRRDTVLTYTCIDTFTPPQRKGGGTAVSFIAEVEEGPPCQYQITIHVPALCRIEPFRATPP